MTDAFIGNVNDYDDDIVYLPDSNPHNHFNSPSSDIVLLSSSPFERVRGGNENQPGFLNQPLNLLDDSFPRVLEIVPDVDHDHLKELLERYRNSETIDQCIQVVVHALLEDPSYPRNSTSTALGKRKRPLDDNGERSARKSQHDFASVDRPTPLGPNYFPLAIQQLQIDYPYIPKQHIRTVLANHKRLYVPSYLFLSKESKDERLSYRNKKTAFRLSGKERIMHDPDFQAERDWLVNYLIAGNDPTMNSEVTGEDEEEEDDDDDDPECEDGVDCACCFSTYAFDRMIQCPEAHLFCRMCCRRYAAVQLGQHNHHLICMDQSNCKQPFPESELARFLSRRLLRLYHRLKQQKEVSDASLEGLEECPFCEYKVVIENPHERLFRCESEDCMAITCRQCKKLDHLPKTCREVEEDAALDVRHTLEEAMTRAMMRNCPKCQKSFIKESGCNKITCVQCGTLSCYICRKIISGYDHFHDRNGANSNDSSKCPLWDKTGNRHDQEVRETAEKLRKQLKEQNPDLPEGTLDVAIHIPNLKSKHRNINRVHDHGGHGGHDYAGHDQYRQQQFQNEMAAIQARMQHIQQQHNAVLAEEMRLRQEMQARREMELQRHYALR